MAQGSSMRFEVRWAFRGRGIIFTGDSVRAILDGSKTQTRRVVKYCPALGEPEAWCADALNPRSTFARVAGDYRRFSPYGAPGHARDDGAGATLYVKEACCPDYFPPGDGPRHAYRADWTARAADVCPEPKWKSPLYMRRTESRITLEIVSVRVERVQDISEEDAHAEGVSPGWIPADDYGPERIGYVLGADDGNCTLYPTAKKAFAVGWDGINGKRAPWSTNPFVWVVEFRRVP